MEDPDLVVKPDGDTQGLHATQLPPPESQAGIQTKGVEVRIKKLSYHVLEEENLQSFDPEAEPKVRRSRRPQAEHEERPGDQPGAPREEQELEGRPAKRARTDPGQFAAQFESDLEEGVRRSLKEQKIPCIGMGSRPGCSHWQEQMPARVASAAPAPVPAPAPVQLPPGAPREGRERDIGTISIGLEEEDQPPGGPAQEQAKEEMRGSSTSRVLENLCKKLEEEKQQKERRNIRLRKVIQDRERSYS